MRVRNGSNPLTPSEDACALSMHRCKVVSFVHSQCLYCCQNPVLGLGLGVDFTFAVDNNHNNNNNNNNIISFRSLILITILTTTTKTKEPQNN